MLDILRAQDTMGHSCIPEMSSSLGVCETTCSWGLSKCLPISRLFAFVPYHQHVCAPLDGYHTMVLSHASSSSLQVFSFLLNSSVVISSYSLGITTSTPIKHRTLPSNSGLQSLRKGSHFKYQSI